MCVKSSPYKTLCSIIYLGSVELPNCRKAVYRVPATIDRARAEKSTNRFSVFQRPSATRRNQYIGRQSLPGLIFSFVAASRLSRHSARARAKGATDKQAQHSKFDTGAIADRRSNKSKASVTCTRRSRQRRLTYRAAGPKPNLG